MHMIVFLLVKYRAASAQIDTYSSKLCKFNVNFSMFIHKIIKVWFVSIPKDVFEIWDCAKCKVCNETNKAHLS